MSEPSYVADDPSGAPAMEYLNAGPPPTPQPAKRKARWWAPILAAGLVFIITLLAVGLVAGDWAARTVEDRALLARIDSSEEAMKQTQDAVQSAINDFSAKPSPNQDDQTALNNALMAAAATGVKAIAAAGDQVAAVKVLPWHTDITKAQQAYLAHNKAWQDYLSRASTDPSEFGKAPEQVNSTFEAAEKPLRDAIPAPDLFELSKHVDEIYAPDPAAGSNSESVAFASLLGHQIFLPMS